MWEDAGSCIAVLVDRRTGEEFNISRYSTSLGRDLGNDLILNSDKTISRQHALIQYTNGRFHVQDLSSKNGTRLNGAKLGQLTELRNGDEITLGLTQLIFILIPQAIVNIPIPGMRTETLVEAVAPGALVGV